MDWMQFVAGMTTALAWPVVVLVVFLVFRKQLIRLIPKLREVTAPGGFAARFEAAMDTVEAVIPPPAAAEPNDEVSFAEEVPEVDPLALKYNPSGVIMETWRDIETSLRIFEMQSSGVVVKQRTLAPMLLAKRLSSDGVITLPELQAFRELQGIRNVVAHASDVPVTEEQAARFTVLADSLLRRWKIRQSVEHVPTNGG